MTGRALRLGRGRLVKSAMIAAPMLCLSIIPADAQSRGRRAEPVAAANPAGPAAPLIAIASLNGQHITVYAGTEKIARSAISSGMSGHRTPTGVFSILQRNRYHESNIYSGAPMPYMQRLTWSGIALHEGNVPGYPASHGCVRLPSGFAQQLWGLGKLGMRVIIAPDAPVPFLIEHDRLPTPIFSPARELTVEEQEAQRARAVRGARRTLPLFALVSPAMAATDARLRMLNPIEAAEVEKRRAALAAVDAAQVLIERRQSAARASAGEDDATADLREAERDIDDLERLLAEAQRRHGVVQSEEDRIQTAASVSVVQEEIEAARRVRDERIAARRSASDAAFAAAHTARDAEREAEKAEFAAKSAQVGTEPVSVFVSRKAGRVFVRQGFTPLLEGDVTIADADRPIGTHVFTAIAVKGDGGEMQWSAVSVPEQGTAGLSARQALDRIELAPDIAAEVGRRVWTGATLIISDHGISSETGKGTDFVVLTK
jgi:hypothetical protein